MIFKRLLKYMSYVLLALVVVLSTGSIYVNNFVEVEEYTEKDIMQKYVNGKFIEVDGNNIFYQEFTTTSDKHVVIVGGTTAWSGTWENVISEIKNESNIYALDMPPFGYTKVKSDYNYTIENQASIINKFIEEKKLKNVTLIAHSYGAGPLFESVFQNQKQFKKIIIVDGAIHVQLPFQETILTNAFGNLIGIDAVKNIVVANTIHLPGFMRMSLESLTHQKDKVTQYWIDVYNEPLKQVGTSKKLANWFHDFVFENAHTGLSEKKENYKDMKVPVVLIWGDKDPLTPYANALYLKEIIPNSKLYTLENVGHMPMIEESEMFINILKENI